MLISEHLPRIIQLISENPVVSVVAGTGSGKSVGIPAAVAAAGAKCYAVVPTRTAATSLAEYQKVLQKKANNNEEEYVGYAAEGNVNYTENTFIAYVTGGHMRRKMESYFKDGKVSPIDFCDVLFVDEVHSGSLDTTIIISLWNTAALANVVVPRLVIASATPVPVDIKPDPVVYTIESANFPIQYKYLDKDIDMDDPRSSLYTETSKIVANIHKNTDIKTGHILVFAAGSAEVQSIHTSLLKLLSNYKDKQADIIPAFGALRQEDIAKIYKHIGDNVRKIVIATNIAEMSITIENIGYVVDTMIEKRAETSMSGGFRLTTHYISKDSAKQRAGRTGRTIAGTCYRMCTEKKYNNLEEHRPPEIDRVPIYDIVMELLDIGLTPGAVLRGVNPSRITTSTNLLTKLGMIRDSLKGVIVTDSGHFAANFPLSVRNVAFLWQWIEKGYPIYPGIVAASIMDCYGPSYFRIPRIKPDQPRDEYNKMVSEHKDKYFSKFSGNNDLETFINMWTDLASYVGGINESMTILSKWSNNNSCNSKKIRELVKIIKSCISTAGRLGYEVTIGPFTTNGVMNAARPLLLSVYSDLTLIQNKNTLYFSPITREDYRLDTRDSVSNLASNPPKGIIAIVTAEIKTANRLLRIISFGVDTDKDGLGRPITVRSRAPKNVISSSSKTLDDDINLLSTLSLNPDSNISTATVNTLSSTNSAVSSSQYELSTYDITTALNIFSDITADNTPVSFDINTTVIPPVDPYNPPLYIEPVFHDGKTFNVIQDTYLDVGTKQRGYKYFLALKEAGYTDVITYATPYGYGQVAVSFACALAGLDCHLFLPKLSNRTPMTQMALDYGVSLYEIGEPDSYVGNKQLSLLSHELSQEKPTSIVLELGLDDNVYIQYLAAGIQEAAIASAVNPSTIWVAGGSAVIARALALAFPGVHLNIVQVGKEIYSDLLENIDHTIYKATEKFIQDATILPPYTSLANYDAKIWQFASRYGNSGDYIWNVK